MSSGASAGGEGSLCLGGSVRLENFLRPAIRHILAEGDGRGGICCSASPPTMCMPRTHAKTDTELQLGHITHPRKAFRARLTQRKLSCWDTQRDGGELIFLFFRSQIKGGGGVGGKGVVLLGSRSYYRLFFFMAVSLEVGGGESPTFSV